MSPYPNSFSGYFLVREVEFTFDLSDLEVDPLTLQVRAIDDQIKAVRASAQLEITNLEGEKQSLLSIAFDQGSATVVESE